MYLLHVLVDLMLMFQYMSLSVSTLSASTENVKKVCVSSLPPVSQSSYHYLTCTLSFVHFSDSLVRATYDICLSDLVHFT